MSAGYWRGFEAENAAWDYATFSANDLTTIVGIPLTLQRAWRSRDQMPGGSGKSASFTSRDVAEIFVRYQLSLNGIPPSESEEIGKIAAQVVIYFALLASDGACEVRGPAKDTARFLERFENETTIAHEIAEKTEAKSFVWRGDGGELVMVSDIQSWIDESQFAANFFINLEVAALRIAESANRPLITVKLSMDSKERRVRRLTGQVEVEFAP